MNIDYKYSLKRRYEFNNIKSGTVTYGESKPSHFADMQERSWTLDVENVDELYEYKNLGVYENYCGSFNANIDENIEKKLVRKRELSSQPTSIGARLTLSFMSSIGNKSAYPLSYLVPRFLSHSDFIKQTRASSEVVPQNHFSCAKICLQYF